MDGDKLIVLGYPEFLQLVSAAKRSPVSGDVALAQATPGNVVATMSRRFYRKQIESRLGKTVEIISDFVYDGIKSTSVTDTYFQTPMSGTKSLTFTNLKKAGEIPFNEEFEVKGIGAYIAPATVEIDMSAATTFWKILEYISLGYFVVKLGNKEYLRGPMSLILNLNVSLQIVARSSAPASDYLYALFNSPFVKDTGYHPLPHGFCLAPTGPGSTFEIDVTYETSPASTNPFYVYIVLFGTRERPVL